MRVSSQFSRTVQYVFLYMSIKRPRVLMNCYITYFKRKVKKGSNLSILLHLGNFYPKLFNNCFIIFTYNFLEMILINCSFV